MDEDDIVVSSEEELEQFSNASIAHMGVTNEENSPIVAKKIEQWNSLTSFLEEWFYQPDLDALKICLSIYAAHHYLQNDPIWVFVIAPPGSGKTSIAIRSLTFLENTHELWDINVNSFLSGFGENNGLLGNLTKKHNGNGVLLFPDFTGLLSKRPDVRMEIMSQMRQIYDGKFGKTVGNKSDTVTWKGKVSCVAAVTPAIEDHWGSYRNLGERFLNVRWNQPDGLKTAEYAEKQIDNKKYVHETFEKLVLEYVDPHGFKSVGIGGQKLGLNGIAYLVSILRTVVHRDVRTKKIYRIDEPETPTRISQALAMIAKGSATLDRRSKISEQDLKLARRVAIDSLSKNRGKVISELLDSRLIDGKFVSEKSTEELRKLTRLPLPALKATLEELVELEAIRIDEGINYDWVTVTDKMQRCWDDHIIGLESDKGIPGE